MSKKRILLIGGGNLGSRHLQALACLPDVASIQVLDKNPESIELCKIRLNEIVNLNNDIRFVWTLDPGKILPDGNLCIIATQAKERCSLLKEVANKLGYKNFIIEKIVSQSLSEYQDLLRFKREKGLSVWVNCQGRTFSVHKYIKATLLSSEPIILSRVGGNFGLACNGIHAADLFVFYDGGNKINGVGSRIDPIIHQNKRGKEIFDLSGTLHGITEKGCEFLHTFAANHLTPDFFSIVTPHARYMIDHHFGKFAYESTIESKWEWRPIELKDNSLLVSRTTGVFALDIFNRGACDLPTLEENYPAHEFILSELLPYFNNLLGTTNEFCPVT